MIDAVNEQQRLVRRLRLPFAVELQRGGATSTQRAEVVRTRRAERGRLHQLDRDRLWRVLFAHVARHQQTSILFVDRNRHSFQRLHTTKTHLYTLKNDVINTL